MKDFTHIDENGRVRMVDVTDKRSTERVAVACGLIEMQADTLERIVNDQVKKGNVLETARIAGVLAAKKTSDLIPMCHPLSITHIKVDFSPDMESGSINIKTEVRLVGQTGVEMEALTAASIAGLTIYDMCKSYDKTMVLSRVYLLKKKGGKSGEFVNAEMRNS